MTKKTIRDIDVANKRVLLRVDFNVPMDPGNGAILDDSRIVAALPTIRFLLDRNASLVLCSHLGRPKGKVKDSLRLGPVARRLSELMKRPVDSTTETSGEHVLTKARCLGPGEVLFLENLRFDPGEESNDP